MDWFKRTLKPCLALFRLRLAEALQYRLAALSGASISVFWAFLEIFVYTVFYAYGDNRAALSGTLSLGQAISYAWLAQVFFPLQPMSIDEEIHDKIISGDVGLELCRPLDVYAHWFSKTAAGRVGGFFLRCGLILLCALLAPAPYRLQAPASAAGFLLFLFSEFSAFLLCTAYGMLIASVRIGITWGEGPTYMLLLASGILSGSYLPLQLWPDSLQTLLLLQPFAGYLDIPLRLYVGSLSPAQAGLGLSLQLAWTLLFILLGRILLQRQLKHIIVQGG